MARGLFSNIQKIAREVERQQAQQQREAIKAQKARERAAQQGTRAAQADLKRQATVAKAAHVETRLTEVEALNAELEETYAAIDGLLAATLNVDNYFDLNTLHRDPDHPPFKHVYLERPTQQPDVIFDPSEPIYEEPPPPKALFGKQKKHEAAIAAAQTDHERAKIEWQSQLKTNALHRKKLQEEWELGEENRLEHLGKEKSRYAEECAEREREVAENNANISSMITNLGYGAADAVEAYISIVLSHSDYPSHFPVSHELKFEPSTAELRLRVVIPPPSELGVIKAYKYVKKDDEIASMELSQAARKNRYASAVHHVALRSIHEVFNADRRGLVKTVSLEVGAEASDPATGKCGFIPFAAVAAKREGFLEFDLSAVVPKSTLDFLGAAVSKNPYELIAADTSGVRHS